MRTSQGTSHGTKVFLILSEKPTAREVISGMAFLGNIDDTIVLNETQRHRRRISMKSDHSIEFLLDLSEAQLMKHGDILPLSDGRHIEVLAEPEALLNVSGKNPQHLLSLAWQIGNRHLAAQILDDHILIRHDHVIAEMLVGLGATVEEVKAPFNPEGGAYGDHHHHHE